MDFPFDNPGILGSVFLFAATLATPSISAEKPPPTPVPRSLAAYAKTLDLKPTAATDDSGRVVIDNDNVQLIGSQVHLITGPPSVASAPTQPPRDEARRRSHWRSRYFKQKQQVHGLERKLSQIDADIDLLEDGRVTPRSLARLARTKARREEIERELKRQRTELGRIVFEARQEGAQPGWFR